MYSKNDYRYYLENQLMHSNDFLAHYGVKGMKWKRHLKRAVIPKDLTYEKSTSNFKGTVTNDYRLDFDKHRGKDGSIDWSEGIGLMTHKNKSTGERSLTVYNTKRVKLDKDGYAIGETKKIGPVRKERAEDGVRYDITLPNKKKKKKSNRKPFTIDSLRRVKPKGQKLNGGGNIYVNHR